MYMLKYCYQIKKFKTIIFINNYKYDKVIDDLQF